MDTLTFLRRVLPSTGLYIIARLVNKGWRHQVCDSLDEAAAYVQQFDAAGVPTYHACAAYREHSVDGVKDGKPIKQVRTHKNVRALRSFFMDLDVKPGNSNAFESQAAALDAMVDFCVATQLPTPMIISSGGGLHLYWTLTDEILPETWRQTASALKKLAAHHQFKADPACTADPARVLRSVGTFNRKGSVPRAVELIADSPDIAYGVFQEYIDAALKAAHVAKPAETITKRETEGEQINVAFAVQRDFPPCSGKKVADRCAQLARVRNTRGCVPEPHWYAAIQLLTHSIEGDALIHEWSSGYEGYSIEETNRKIIQVREQAMGPTLCSTFEDRAPGGCSGCPFKGKISSPVQLGTVIASAPAPKVLAEDGKTEVELPKPPDPFTRGENGGIYMEEDGITHKIYGSDCYPAEIIYDERQGFETMRIRHHQKREGWGEFSVRSSLLAKPVEFEVALRDNHIQPLIRNRMTMYFDSYLRSMREEQRIRRLFRSMGWKNDNTEFVLGEKLYTKDGMVQTGASRGSNEFLANFRARGSIEPWKEVTSIFNQPGLAPHAFFLLLAFASPLLRLAGEHGFTVCALGETGAGKTTMAKLLASVYGHPEATWGSFRSTDKARFERLGMYNAIPVYTDEVSHMAPEEVSPLLYMIATGKGRDSLTRNREVREGMDWATIFACSTNQSLQSKLRVGSANPEAESMRLFEFWFPKVDAFAGPARTIPPVILENYGAVGAAYIEGLVRERARIVPELWRLKNEIEAEFGMATQERFWTHAIAFTLYGGNLAREWGLIDFDPAVIKPWLRSETQRMRSDVSESVVSYLALFGQFLNETVGERLVVTSLNKGMAVSHMQTPRSVSQRWEKDVNLLWITRTVLLDWMRKRGVNERQFHKDFRARGILLDGDARKVLGAGTSVGGSQVPCWKISTDHPDLNMTEEVK